jgi:hypothetical protein
MSGPNDTLPEHLSLYSYCTRAVAQNHALGAPEVVHALTVSSLDLVRFDGEQFCYDFNFHMD